MPAPAGITFPPHILNVCQSSRFRPMAVNLTSRGLFTGKQLVDGPIYQIWQASIEFPPLEREKWQEIEAIIVRAYDNRTPFRVFDPMRQKPLGTFGNAGTGVGTRWGDDTTWSDGTLWDDEYFNGMAAAENAPAGRDSLLIEGAPAGQQRVSVPGDVIEINGFLYQVTNETHANAGGQVRINVRPRLREGVVVGDQIRAFRAKGSFYVKDPANFMITRNSYTKWGSTSIEFVEALP